MLSPLSFGLENPSYHLSRRKPSSPSKESMPTAYPVLTAQNACPKARWWEIRQYLNLKFIYPGASKKHVPCGTLEEVKQHPDQYLTDIFDFYPNGSAQWINRKKEALPDMLKRGLQEQKVISESGIEHPVWFVPPQPAKPTLVIASGNGGTRSLGDILDYKPYAEKGYGLATFEYPGYGITPGTPTSKSTKDAFKAVSHLLAHRQNIPIQDQIPLAISMGTPIATENVAKEAEKGNHYRALILQTPITSMQDAAKNMVNFWAKEWGSLAFLKHLVPTWLVHCYSTISHIGKIKSPVFFLAATDDFLAPPKEVAELQSRAMQSPMTRLEVVEGGHRIDKHVSQKSILGFLEELERHHLPRI